jgi:hypothetical protein
VNVVGEWASEELVVGSYMKGRVLVREVVVSAVALDVAMGMLMTVETGCASWDGKVALAAAVASVRAIGGSKRYHFCCAC